MQCVVTPLISLTCNIRGDALELKTDLDPVSLLPSERCDDSLPMSASESLDFPASFLLQDQNRGQTLRMSHAIVSGGEQF